MNSFGRCAALLVGPLIGMTAVLACSQALANGFTVEPQKWSEWIQESGKDKKEHSEFICPDDTVLIGRKHKGDENGDTAYLCGKVLYNGEGTMISTGATSFSYARWSVRLSENRSNYTCPVNRAMTGRRHYYDENGKTEYLCAPIIYEGTFTVLAAGTWSDPIKESGTKASSYESAFTCPANQVMVGRQHNGDENADTRYMCALIVADQSPAVLDALLQSTTVKKESGKDTEKKHSSFVCPPDTVMTFRAHSGDENDPTTYGCKSGTVEVLDFKTVAGDWSEWKQESGKNSGGESSFTCPAAQVIVGREHEGDENGNTRYLCARVLVRGSIGAWGMQAWSDWVKESSSSFECPQNEVMIGREHKGDENGNTRYSCASIVMPYMTSTLQLAVNDASRKVGWPATTDPPRFATRDAMRIDKDYFLHLDIGGEGYHFVSGTEAGFFGAINVNAKTTDSQPPHVNIPFLILVNAWLKEPPYPFANGTANYITLQSAPLEEFYVDEMARVIAKNGQIGLWIDEDRYKDRIDKLAKKLNSKVEKSDKDPNCFDEFSGKAGFKAKICIVNRR